MDLQAETIRKKVSLDETTHQREVDHKLLMKELQITKRNAKESQARANALAHENSKLLHEIQINLQRAEKAERRCVELAAKQSNEQIRVTELEYLNTQLQSQLEQYQLDGCKTTQRIKQSLEDLREQHRKDEQRRAQAQSILRKCCSVLGPIRGTTTGTSAMTSPATGTRQINFNQEIFKELRNAIEHISKLLGDSPDDEGVSSSLHGNDCEGMVVRICAIGESQSQQNLELKNQLEDCREELQKERERNESVLNRYKESLEKVKNSSQTLKQSLLDMQQVNKLEKEQLEQKAKDQIKELIRQKDQMNKTLNKADRTIDSLGNKVEKLKEQNQQLVQDVLLAEKSASKAKQQTRLLIQELNYLKQKNNNNNESSNYEEREEEQEEEGLDGNYADDSEDIRNSQRSSSDVNESRQSRNKKSQYSYDCSNNASQKFNQGDESDNDISGDNRDSDRMSGSHDPNELMTFANTELSNSNHWGKSKQSMQRQEEDEDEEDQKYYSHANGKKYISSINKGKSQIANNQKQYAMILNSHHNLKGNSRKDDGITNYYSFARRTTKQDEEQSAGSVSHVIEQEITELDDEINQIKMSLAHELTAIDSSKA